MSDFANIVAPDAVRMERLLPGPVERVWAYLVDADKRSEWFAGGEIEGRLGGRVEFIFNHDNLAAPPSAPPAKYAEFKGETRMHERVTRWEPPRALAFTWVEKSAAGETQSEVTFELSPRGEEVLLVLLHRRLASRADMLSISGGWHAHLDLLTNLLRGRPPEPFWTAHTALEAEYEKRFADL